jgi:hypothetical protein
MKKAVSKAWNRHAEFISASLDDCICREQILKQVQNDDKILTFETAL